MPNGRVSTSMEEPFYITAVPDPLVPIPSDEDLPKVTIIGSSKFTVLFKNLKRYILDIPHFENYQIGKLCLCNDWRNLF